MKLRPALAVAASMMLLAACGPNDAAAPATSSSTTTSTSSSAASVASVTSGAATPSASAASSADPTPASTPASVSASASDVPSATSSTPDTSAAVTSTTTTSSSPSSTAASATAGTSTTSSTTAPSGASTGVAATVTNKLSFTLLNVDDDLTVSVNGTTVITNGLRRGNEGALPAVDLTSKLVSGANTVHVVAHNSVGLSAFRGHLDVDGKVIKTWNFSDDYRNNNFVDDTFAITYVPPAAPCGKTTVKGSLTAEITRVDDKADIYVNGTLAYSDLINLSKRDDVIDLTSYLTAGSNNIRVVAANDTYLSSLAGTLSADGTVLKTYKLYDLRGKAGVFFDETCSVTYAPTITPTHTAVTVTKSFTGSIVQVDDTVAIYVNGVRVGASTLIRMNQPQYDFDLSSKLTAGKNTVRIVANNQLGAGVLIGSITADGTVVKSYKKADYTKPHADFIDDYFDITYTP